MIVTIFTPTYNRKEKLERLYINLTKQTCCEFEWLIVDDGSTDETEKFVHQLTGTQDKFSIRYIKKRNGGKYTAYNVGVKEALGDLFVCVDSDDFLEEKAIEKILEFKAKINDTGINGIIALKKDSKGRLLSDELPQNVEKCRIIDLEQKYSCRGEFTFVFKTEIVKKYLFPEINGENFMGESVIYDQIDQQGQMYLTNHVFTVCEYCEDGYTQNFMKVVLNNPTGYQIYYKQRIDLAINVKERVGYIIRYHAFKRMTNNHKYVYKGQRKILVASLSPAGYLAYRLYMRKKRKL